MSHWQIASRSLRALEAITDGLPAGKAPRFDTRGPTERLHEISSNTSNTLSDGDSYVATGAWPIAAFWGTHSALAMAGVLAGGGGGWLLWMAIGLFGVLRQTSNVVRVNPRRILVREGLAGRAERHIALTQLSAVWVQQGRFGRSLNIGRVGMQLTTGEVVWGPVIAHPTQTKRAIANAVGRRAFR
ncbi:PH (Pleckstrin Homology) domain-containing protein [Paraperlucidibaca baekdonensis]|uniref:PH (Pleckstrin Homology) domain-containing protein n=1 Tax=Paraperlucidibaca baekdonensis TaxID=748120 RepID=A0A3E0HA00_9GAMM|nr:PH domain-containing protein [Paraperlucidibaca baekdonensis]REH40453.1 PH (Pleckstrin Homology) domain-containing protein [Paraperlucidibaca baekdonensis]